MPYGPGFHPGTQYGSGYYPGAQPGPDNQPGAQAGPAQNPGMQQMYDQMTQSFAAFPGYQQPKPKKHDHVNKAWQMGITQFEGTTDPTEAKNWITRLELIFEALMCPGEEKVATITLLLAERALQWWLAYRRRRPNQTVFTWTEFRTAFDRKFMPQIYRDAKHEEFLRLFQGSLSVADYEAKFTDLGRYAPDYTDNEHRKCRRFERGLRDEIRKIVTFSGFSDFTELVEASLRVESSMDQQKRRTEKSKKRSMLDSQAGGRYRPIKKSNSSGWRLYSESRESKRPQCPICKRYHFESVGRAREASICYHCRPGHYM
ncbi:hypothetical protein J5N97_026075 [Dioscorea zingiberensis]|uniref:Retrotransposon gag domain-containing protein n=1 Tax=Dioscorea zingiberensis TaxID=325984 RepID=A0A9D5H6I4_9LILI|nr:hypothetical protein J5N97_026075 [Dioscorea zingiberensis]